LEYIYTGNLKSIGRILKSKLELNLEKVEIVTLLLSKLQDTFSSEFLPYFLNHKSDFKKKINMINQILETFFQFCRFKLGKNHG